MDVMFWTFPHRGGKWSVAAGKPEVLECGIVRVPVDWHWNRPIMAGFLGTRWVEGEAVQQGIWPPKAEKSGGAVDYYKVAIHSPTSGGAAYTAECNDVIEALGMNYAEGNAFKAIWRRAAARTLGKAKKGYTDGLYDAEKVEFFGRRLVAQEQALPVAAKSEPLPYIGPERRACGNDLDDMLRAGMGGTE